ncbi:hypothetical protein CWI36_0960p0010 [Hamiltosporidium magnivora]|uniref:Exopolyphosphatase n=1 Tax=Hamiltosporidium magnivora TaxID=148818 RepID=A0A4Q9L6I5_9MICR|nr:hypothetical protein CWI36_0960p0010 [Hamiltosporidium magnivora]
MKMLTQKLKEYFTKNKKRIQHSEVKIAIGNEGCDLDSFVSSLVVGYAEDIIHVVNMKKEVFKCKGELMWVIDKFKIDIEDLIFLERPLGNFKEHIRKAGTSFVVGDKSYRITDKNITLVLTDHNKPIEELNEANVEMIIDHHRLEDKVSEAKRIYIDTDVGSATTLVSKYLGSDLAKKHHCVTHPDGKDNIPLLEDETDPDKDHETLCVSLAKLLLIPIIIDTGHLKRRTSTFDYLEYHRLMKVANLKKKEVKKFRKVIKKVRRNDNEQPTNIILQKDFKIYRSQNFTFGCSTIKYDFEEWAERESKEVKGFNKDRTGMILYLVLENFRREIGLDFLFVGCKLKKKRHFIIVGFPYMSFLKKTYEFVELEYKGLIYYKVPVKLSRKILMPDVKNLVERIKLTEGDSNLSNE